MTRHFSAPAKSIRKLANRVRRKKIGLNKNDICILNIARLSKQKAQWNIIEAAARINYKNHNIKFSLVNRLLTKRNVSEVIDTIFRYCGQKETVIFCDRIKTLGFKHAFKAGISFGKDDLIIPNTNFPKNHQYQN